MNLLADESVDRAVIERLRADGHTVGAVAEIAPGILDAEVLSLTNDRAAILVTMDKDFGELIVRDWFPVAGAALFRLDGLSAEAKAERAASAFASVLDRIVGAFVVIDAERVRVRPLPTAPD